MAALASGTDRRYGKNWYVATTGNDTTGTGSISAPFATVTHADGVVAAGDNIIIRGGTYTTAWTFNSSGTSAKWVHIYAYPGETVTVDGTSMAANTQAISLFGNYVELRGITVANSQAQGIYAWDNHDVRIIGNTVYNSQNTGILTGGDAFATSYNITISNNLVYHNMQKNLNGTQSSWGQGITCQLIQNAVIVGNTVYENWGEGVGPQQCDPVTVTDNTIYDNFSVNLYIDSDNNVTAIRNFIYNVPNTTYYHSSHGAIGIGISQETSGTRNLTNLIIQNNIVNGTYDAVYYFKSVASGPKNSIFQNNTFISPVRSGFRSDSDTGISGNIIQNNIFYTSTSVPLTSIPASGYSFDHNVWYGGTASKTGTGDVTSNPNLAAPATKTAVSAKPLAGSPVLGAGVTLSGITEDFARVARSGSYSIGAYQTT